MRKVLVVITTGFVSCGGLTTVFMNYYRVMDKSQLQIDVASIGNAELKLKNEIEENGGRYYALPSKQKKPLKYFFALNSICKGYDVIHVHGNSATMAMELFVGRIHGVPNRIAHSHNTCGMHPIIHAMLKKVFNCLYTTGLACSEAAGTWLYTKEFKVLNNAIDTKRYSYDENVRNETRVKLGINDAFVIGHVGKFVDAKNHDFILKIFKIINDKYPKTILILIGDGENKEHIISLVQDLNIKDNVYFAGMINDTEKYYSAMDCFILPSFHEGLSLALLEAQASGLRCVVSENVTSENAITKNVEFLELEENKWIQYLSSLINNYKDESRREDSVESVKSLKQCGYDNNMSGNILLHLYEI